MAIAMDLSLLQLAIFGFFTGLGTTFGAKLAELLFEKLKKRLAKPRL
jgi:hypothetical protein